MRTTNDIVMAVHARANGLRRARARRRLALAGWAGGALGVMLILAIGSLSGLQHRAAGVGYEGASLLTDDAGGYVLAAVVAFMAGVAVTVLCMRSKDKDGK